jgi:hypothetical protein
LEGNELGSLVGGVGSAAIGLYGFLSQAPYVGSVFIVLMTVSFTFFFNSRIQSSSREYERRRLQTTEVLGPVYGQVTSNLEQMERKKATLDTDLGPASGNEWGSIKLSYRAELIDGDLRLAIERFFSDLDRLQTLMGPAREMLRRIEKDTWASIFSVQPGNDGGHLYTVIDDYRHQRSGRVYDAVFWEKNPTEQFDMRWKSVDVIKDRGGQNNYPIHPEETEVPEVMVRFFPEAGARASANLEIVNARAEYERILKEGYELRERLRKLISEWAKP